MNAAQPAARRLAVPALVTTVVAAWFVVASGAALAEAVPPSAVAALPTQVTLTPEGAMKLTVVATRPAAQVTLTPEGFMKLTVVASRPATQVTMTPDGTMKLTVVAQRPQTERLHTAVARQTPHS